MQNSIQPAAATIAGGVATLAQQVAYYQQVFAQMGLPQVIAAAPGGIAPAAILGQQLGQSLGQQLQQPIKQETSRSLGAYGGSGTNSGTGYGSSSGVYICEFKSWHPDHSFQTTKYHHLILYITV